MSLKKDKIWNTLSNERKKDLLPIVFKRTIAKPVVLLPILFQIIFLIYLSAFSPEYQYKYPIDLVLIFITVKIALLPYKNHQLKEFYKLVDLENKENLTHNYTSKNKITSYTEEFSHPKIHYDTRQKKYSVQTRKWLVYYFKYFKDYESALMFIESDQYKS